jgi:hypothetical protein
VGDDTPRPAQHPVNEREQRSRVPPGEQDGKPGDHDCKWRGDPEEEQDEVVRNRQQPLHQRQPAIGVSSRIWVVVVEMDRLMVASGRVAVVRQSKNRDDAVGESLQFEIPVEPPARALAQEKDHEQRTEEQRCTGAVRRRRDPCPSTKLTGYEDAERSGWSFCAPSTAMHRARCAKPAKRWRASSGEERKYGGPGI